MGNDTQRRVQPGSLTGQLLEDRFLVGERIGTGGMGDVYLATDQTGRIADPVVKTPRHVHDEDAIEGFRRESKRHRRLARPTIVPVYHVGECGGLPFLVMRHMRGGNLAARLKPASPQTVMEVLHWLKPAADALDYMHRQGLFHRDVKPNNILFDAEGPNAAAQLADFGIAKSRDSRTATTGVRGAYDWMPPEAGDAKFSPQYDQYSLALMVYEALSGEIAGDGENEFARFLSRRTGKIQDLCDVAPEVDPEISRTVMKALGVHLFTRFESCGAFVGAIEGRERELTASRSVNERGAPGTGREIPVGLVSPDRRAAEGAFAEGPVAFNRPTPASGVDEDDEERAADEPAREAARGRGGAETVVRQIPDAAFLTLAPRKEAVRRKPMPPADGTVLRQLVVPKRRVGTGWWIAAGVATALLLVIAAALFRAPGDVGPALPALEITSPSPHLALVLPADSDSALIEGRVRGPDAAIRVHWTRAAPDGRSEATELISERADAKWWYRFAPPADGRYTLAFRTDGPDNRAASARLVVVRDRTPPTLTVKARREDHLGVDREARFRVSLTDEISRILMPTVIDGQDVHVEKLGTDVFEIRVALTPGEVRDLEIRASDAAGNEVSTTVMVSAAVPRPTPEPPAAPPPEPEAPVWITALHAIRGADSPPPDDGQTIWFGAETELRFGGRVRMGTGVVYEVVRVEGDGTSGRVTDPQVVELGPDGSFVISGIEVDGEGLYRLQATVVNRGEQTAAHTALPFRLDLSRPVVRIVSRHGVQVVRRSSAGDVLIRGSVNDASPTRVRWRFSRRSGDRTRRHHDEGIAVVEDGAFLLRIPNPFGGAYDVHLDVEDRVGLEAALDFDLIVPAYGRR